MRGTIVLDRPIEYSILHYSILHNAKPIGPSMGLLRGPRNSGIGNQRIWTALCLRRRRTTQCNCAFDVDALAAGEFIVRPGLIYCRVGAKTSWRQTPLRTLSATCQA